MNGTTGLPGAAPQVSSRRLLGIMGGAGALAGLLIVLVYQATLPTVQAHRAARLETAIHQVLPGIARYETLYLVNGSLTSELPAGADSRKLETIYAGFSAGGQQVGFAIPIREPGFQDVIEMIVGFDPSRPGTIGLVILGSRETPGLGDKIEAPQWLAQFSDAPTPLSPVKAGNSASPGEVDMITGATISSRTVVTGINKGVVRWTPILDRYRAGG
jgi:Na+-translocating ferredoxin:NAD+ oxidoreductase subunit G